MPRSWRRAAARLLAELENERLAVELFPARRQSFDGHMIRIATGVNPPWYRALAAKIPPRHRRPGRCSSGIRRAHVAAALRRLAAGDSRPFPWSALVLPVVAAEARRFSRLRRPAPSIGSPPA